MELTWIMGMTGGAGSRAADEAALIAASREGDTGAFSDLVRLHQRRIFRLAGRFFRRREDVEDAAQDTFLTAWRRLSTYRGRAPFEHWLSRVCLNCCYARLRRARPEEIQVDMSVLREPGFDPHAAIEVERLLSRLSPGDRFVLLLLDGEGWSVAEIASRLGWTTMNVKVRAHRARKKLRKVLTPS